jgi:hypothetical protein
MTTEEACGRFDVYRLGTTITNDDDIVYTREDLARDRLNEVYEERDKLAEKYRRLSDRIIKIESQQEIITSDRVKERRQICMDLVLQVRRTKFLDKQDVFQACWYMAVGRWDVEIADVLFPEVRKS